MKEQTYISKIEDANGNVIDFERWSYKRVSTVIKKSTEFFKRMSKHNFFRERVKNAERINIYDNNGNVVKTILLKKGESV